MLNNYDFEKNKMLEDFVKLQKTVEELKIKQESHDNEILSLNRALDNLKKKQENPDNTFAELTLSALSSYVKELDKSYGIQICNNCRAVGHNITKCAEECKGNCPRNFKSHIPSECPFQAVNSSTKIDVLHKEDPSITLTPIPDVSVKPFNSIVPKSDPIFEKNKIRSNPPKPEMYVEPFNVGL